MNIKDFINMNNGNVSAFIITDGDNSISVDANATTYSEIESIICNADFVSWDILPSKKTVILYI